MARPVLDRSAPASEEIAKVLRHWTLVLDSVRPAVVQDVDIECLREFRAAARSIRAMLLLSASSLPGADLDRYLGEFSWLADLAAPVRAADVLLLDIAGRGELDVTDIDHLGLIAEQLQRSRRTPLRTLRAGLASQRAAELTPKWLDALDRLERGGVTGTATTSQFARTQAEAAFRRVVKLARLVDPTVPAAELHQLRKRIRTLRVVLDTYSTVYPDELADPLAKAARLLHRQLGAVQDSAAAAAGFTEAAHRLGARASAPADVVLAIGALRERAHAREVRARAELADPLTRLTGKKLARAADALVRSV